MKAILLMFDSVNRHFLSSYGCDWTETPNFKRLSEKSVTFDNCYVASLPCIPARRELHTGRYNFLHRSWGPLEPFDDSMPEILRKNSIYTHLVSDHQHYWEDGGATYHHRYDTWDFIRGQEGDRWKGVVGEVEIPEHLGRIWRQDVVNRQYIKTEADMPIKQVFDSGLEFLERNKNEENWFLHLEAFDPHEPFFTFDHYKKFYPHEYDGPLFEWPEYRDVTEPLDAVEHLKYEYAATLTMADNYLGKILDFMDANNMWEDTMLIVNTDHGFLLGERDLWAKCVHPFYNEVAHIPFFVWDPRFKIAGERRNSLVQTVDIAPTILEYFGLPLTSDMEGRPLSKVIRNDQPIREFALFGMHGAQVNITDGRYVYMRDYVKDNQPLYNYTLMPTHMRQMFSLEELRTVTIHEGFKFTKNTPVMKIKAMRDGSGDTALLNSHGTRLYDLKIDPQQLKPISDTEVENKMKENMIKMMKKNDAPVEQFERLGLL